MRKVAIVILGLLLFVAGCGVVEGAGKDLRWVGQQGKKSMSEYPTE